MIRTVFFTVIACNVIVVLFALVYTSVFVSNQEQKIYALQGEVPIMVALNQNVRENRLAEAKAQLEEFHRCFFAVNPDQGEIEFNIKRALDMSDNSVIDQYKKLVEVNYFEQIVEANIRCTYRNDSVLVDLGNYPYRVTCYGRIGIIRPTGCAIRRLTTSCSLRNVNRTDKIPHGFLIENFQILDNSDLSTGVKLFQ